MSSTNYKNNQRFSIDINPYYIKSDIFMNLDIILVENLSRTKII